MTNFKIINCVGVEWLNIIKSKEDNIENDGGDSIKSALSYLISESYRIHDFGKAIVLQSAYDYLDDMDAISFVCEDNYIEKRKVNKILSDLNPSEMQYLISLFDTENHKLH